jgi:hypothetical protein
MPKVKTQSLVAGMVIAADVKNMDNMLLMPAGCELTEKHITILNAWGIPEVQVESCDGQEEPADVLQQLAPELLNQLADELQAIFWEPIDRNPIQREVFDLVLRRKAKALLT